MAFSAGMDNKFYLGIDGGGSKCRAVIASFDREILGEGLGGPANPMQGFQKTIDSILDATDQALINAGMTPGNKKNLIAGIGLAGVNFPVLFRQVNQWEHPFHEMYLTTDLDIANIGAHDANEGAVIIVGTGSCGYSSTGGEKAILGGLGFPIGDQASGAWMGLEAIKHSILVLDGFESPSLMSQMLIQKLAVKDALSLSEQIAGRSSREFAKLASLVFKAADQGDQIAKKIVDDGINYIIKMSQVLLSSHPKRLCMIGGLAKFILPRLPKDLACQFVEPILQPEVGALRFAEQRWCVEHKKSAQV